MPGNALSGAVRRQLGGIALRAPAHPCAEVLSALGRLHHAIDIEGSGVEASDAESRLQSSARRDTVTGECTDTTVGLDGNHANIAMRQTPDGNGRLELFEYIRARRTAGHRPGDH